MTAWLVTAGAILFIGWMAWSLDRYERSLEHGLVFAPDDPEDWTPPWLLDRAVLLELPYSPVVSDDELLRDLAEIRELPETAA